jgi:hypothetical protein
MRIALFLGCEGSDARQTDCRHRMAIDRVVLFRVSRGGPVRVIGVCHVQNEDGTTAIVSKEIAENQASKAAEDE